MKRGYETSTILGWFDLAVSHRLAWVWCWLISQALGLVCLGVYGTMRGVEPAVYGAGAIGALFAWYLPAAARRRLTTPWVVVLYALGVGFGVSFFWFATVILFGWFRRFVGKGMFVYADFSMFLAYTRSYLFSWIGLGFLACWASVSYLWYREPEVDRELGARVRRVLAGGGVAVVVVAGAVSVAVERPGGLLPPDLSVVAGLPASLTADADLLHEPNRRGLERVDQSTTYNVLLVLNEGIARRGLQSYDPALENSSMPRLEEWLASEGRRSLVFERHVTASSRSHLAIPSLLAAVAPHSSVRRLHRVPLAWHWAEAAGMTSLFASSASYRLESMDEYLFRRAPPDALVTADEFEGAWQRRSGVDEFRLVERFRRMVDAVPADEPVFAVLSTFATHFPYQTSSPRWSGKARGETAFERASDLLDAALHRVFEHWRTSGRLDDTIVVFTADHGRSNRTYHDVPRIFSMYDDVMRVPLIIRVPPSFPERHPDIFAGLRANRSRMTHHYDLVPTLADLVGALEHPHNRGVSEMWDGRRLTEAVPSDRTFVTMTSDEFTTWGYDAVGVFWPGRRFIASTYRGMQYYELDDDPHQQRNVWPELSPASNRRIGRAIRAHPRVYDVYRDIASYWGARPRFAPDPPALQER